jgi:hypothetical protein
LNSSEYGLYNIVSQNPKLIEIPPRKIEIRGYSEKNPAIKAPVPKIKDPGDLKDLKFIFSIFLIITKRNSMAKAKSSKSTKATKPVRSTGIVKQLEANIAQLLFIAAVVVAFFVAWLVGPNYETKAAHWHSWFRHGTVAGVILAVALVTCAVVTGMAYTSAKTAKTAALILLVLFLAIAGLFTFAMWYHFRRSAGDPKHVAFYLMIAVVVGALIHSYFIFKALGFMGVVGMVPLLLTGAYVLYQVRP